MPGGRQKSGNGQPTSGGRRVAPATASTIIEMTTVPTSPDAPAAVVQGFTKRPDGVIDYAKVLGQCPCCQTDVWASNKLMENLENLKVFIRIYTLAAAAAVSDSDFGKTSGYIKIINEHVKVLSSLPVVLKCGHVYHLHCALLLQDQNYRLHIITTRDIKKQGGVIMTRPHCSAFHGCVGIEKVVKGKNLNQAQQNIGMPTQPFNQTTSDWLNVIYHDKPLLGQYYSSIESTGSGIYASVSETYATVGGATNEKDLNRSDLHVNPVYVSSADARTQPATHPHPSGMKINPAFATEQTAETSFSGATVKNFTPQETTLIEKAWSIYVSS